MIALGLKLDQAKGLFFDRAAVTSKLSPAARRALGKIGAMIRQDSRKSIRPISKKKKKAITEARQRGDRRLARKLEREATSKPGEPPKSILGFLRMIFYSYDPANKSVVVGPVLLNGRKSAGRAPRILEEGGDVTLRSKITNKTRRVHVKPRPYMLPPFKKHAPKLPALMRDSVKP